MQIFKTKTAIYKYVLNQKKAGKSVGLIPTMGALHAGHLSLIQKSKAENNFTIATIFVNPTQFNNTNDLIKYPQPIALDIKMLENAGCDVLFLPSTTEMYSTDESWDYNIGELANMLEGAYRPGHFKGVTQIVYKLFNAIPATTAYFGQKDFQQFLVIQQLVSYFKIPVKLECCPIVREYNGLALSSRNVHLNAVEKVNALVLVQSLNFIKQNFYNLPLNVLINNAKKMFIGLNGVSLEYLEICDKCTLHPLQSTKPNIGIALVAAMFGNTRLIDSMILD